MPKTSPLQRHRIGQTHGRLCRAGNKYEGLQKVAKAVANPASRCELVVTPRVTVKQESDSTWKRALHLACAPGSGWRLDGRSVVRVTAADHGF